MSLGLWAGNLSPGPRELTEVSLAVWPGPEPLQEGGKVAISLPEPDHPWSEHTVHGT